MQKALDLNSEAPFVHVSLGEVLIAKRQPEPALMKIEKESSDWGKLTGEAIVSRALGREQNSDVVLTTLTAKYDTDSAYQIAQAYAFRGANRQVTCMVGASVQTAGRRNGKPANSGP